MIKGFQQVRQLRDGSQFVAWIVAIARNLSINQLRKRKNREEAVSEWSAVAGVARVAGILPACSEGVPPSNRGRDVRDTDASEDLRRAVARLPADLRLPLVMYYFDGQDVKTVAKMLEMSTSGVYLKLRTAIKELHEMLTTQGDTP